MNGVSISMRENSILQVKDLTKKYEQFLLDSINFDLEAGKITGLIEANGAGKSTTMKLLLRTI